MQKIHLENILWKEGEHYVAQCLNVEVSSFGYTKQEAINNLNEALELYFEDENGTPISNIEQVELIHTELNYA